MLKTYVESNNLDMTVIERFYETYRKLADITNVLDFIKKTMMSLCKDILKEKRNILMIY